LIFFSGAESRILESYYNAWLTVKDWNPESRYKRQHITNAKAVKFIAAAKQILKQIT
jgi:hypothetical protein